MQIIIYYKIYVREAYYFCEAKITHPGGCCFCEAKITYARSTQELRTQSVKIKIKDLNKCLIFVLEMLSPEQHKIFEKIKKSKPSTNIFLHGPGGSGKSYLIEAIYKYMVSIWSESEVFKTSTTGQSAYNIGGETIHAWSGIGINSDSSPIEILNDMKGYTRMRFQKTKVLIIDEISMLGFKTFELFMKLRLALNKNIKIIVSGDFFQLAPVKDKFCFESEYWNFEEYRLYTIYRQESKSFQKMLNEIRYGICTKQTELILKARVGVKLKNKNGIKPIQIYPLNKSVDAINRIYNKKLLDLGLENYVYNSINKVEFNVSKLSTSMLLEKFDKVCNAENTIHLTVGTQVMFKVNLKSLTGVNIYNGTKGVVSSFQSGYPIITLTNGNVYYCTRFKYEYTDKKTFRIIKEQLPLKLAWSCSSHSSQGMSIDLVKADIGENIFEPGQPYVILSRVKSLEGLSLVAFDPKKIIVNDIILKKFAPDVYFLVKGKLDFLFPSDIIKLLIEYLC